LPRAPARTPLRIGSQRADEAFKTSVSTVLRSDVPDIVETLDRSKLLSTTHGRPQEHTMPFDFDIPRNPVSISVAGYNSASMCAMDCAFPQEAFATKEEVRYAHQLRLQLRERFLRRPVLPARPWSVGAD